MSVCGNDAISPNKCDATPPPDIYTNPRTPALVDSVSNVSEPSKVPPHPLNANSSAEESGLIS